MEICDAHAKALTAYLHTHGIGHLEAPTEEEKNLFVDVINGEHDEEEEGEVTFDALIMAQTLLFNEAHQCAGDGIFDEVDTCPMCELIRLSQWNEGQWLDAVCEHVTLLAAGRGLLKFQ